MDKRRPNEEIFKDGDREIRLVADFGFMCAVSSRGRDVTALFNDLSEGLTSAEDIFSVLYCAAVDLPEDERKELIESLITRYGLQECAIMARVMLSHAMLGDVKKSQIDRGEEVQNLLEQFLPSQSKTLKQVGLLWGATSIASTLLVCGIFNLFGLPTF